MKFPTRDISFHYTIFVSIRKTEFNKQTKSYLLTRLGIPKANIFSNVAINFFVCQQQILLFADNLCKQFRPRSDLAECSAYSGSTLFDTLDTRHLNEFYEKVKFEKVSR